MNVSFESSAKKYISAKGNVIHIYTTPISGCCGGQMSIDLSGQVKLGPPHERDLAQFISQEIDGIKVYIQRQLASDSKERQISLKKFLFLEQLIIE